MLFTQLSIRLYTWSPSYPSTAKALGFNPIPMLWGDDQIDQFTELVTEGYADIVFGMNEYVHPSFSPCFV